MRRGISYQRIKPTGAIRRKIWMDRFCEIFNDWNQFVCLLLLQTLEEPVMYPTPIRSHHEWNQKSVHLPKDNIPKDCKETILKIHLNLELRTVSSIACLQAMRNSKYKCIFEMVSLHSFGLLSFGRWELFWFNSWWLRNGIGYITGFTKVCNIKQNINSNRSKFRSIYPSRFFDE